MTVHSTTMIATQDLIELQEQTAETVRQERLVRSTLGHGLCQECGGTNGMAGWSYEFIAGRFRLAGRFDLPETFYRLPGINELFTPCDACNPHGYIPKGYIAMADETEIDTWAARGPTREAAILDAIGRS